MFMFLTEIKIKWTFVLLLCDLADCYKKKEGIWKPASLVPYVGVWGFGLCSGFLPLPLQWHSCLLRYSTHDIYPGEGIDRCFKAALWHGQERPLVTLDKAGDYHINLCVVLPCWKAHRTSQWTPASPAASSTLRPNKEGKGYTAWPKCLLRVQSCVFTGSFIVAVSRLAGCSLWCSLRAVFSVHSKHVHTHIAVMVNRNDLIDTCISSWTHS